MRSNFLLALADDKASDDIELLVPAKREQCLLQLVDDQPIEIFGGARGKRPPLLLLLKLLRLLRLLRLRSTLEFKL